MWPLKSHLEPRILAFISSSTDSETIATLASTSALPVIISRTLNHSLARDAAIVILDRDLTGADWRPNVTSLVHSKLNPCVILLSRVADDYLFEELTRQGGFDITTKPIRIDELQRIIKLALNFWKNRRLSG
jgi:FixJ family two-component response regulator